MADRKITAMHREYGKDIAHRCADCQNLCIHVTTSHTRYKCMAYGVSFSSVTDWAKKWAACGLCGKPLPADHVPLIKRLTSTKQQEKPIDGQITFLGTEEQRKSEGLPTTWMNGEDVMRWWLKEEQEETTND